MRIENLKLGNFRNYDNLEMEFSPGVNLLYGDNAQGKTNILEAIFLAATTKSIRGSKDREMIKLGTEESHIRLQLKKNDIAHRIDMHLKKSKAKGAAIDGFPVKRGSELFGLLHVIAFSPDDLYMMKNGPAERRRFLDMELCQLEKVYCSYLLAYNKLLMQRNALLKQISQKPSLLETLEVWNQQLIVYGSSLIVRREAFLTELAPILKEKHQILSCGKETLTIEYEPNVKKEDFAAALSAAQDKDLLMKTTTVGPHRDDIAFYINEKNVRLYGSQGQQRTVALSLKLAEIELVKKKILDTPVLLLDDVLSELDRNRQLQLLGEMQDIQTIVTCTGMEEFVECRPKGDRIYQVKDNRVYQR